MLLGQSRCKIMLVNISVAVVNVFFHSAITTKINSVYLDFSRK